MQIDIKGKINEKKLAYSNTLHNSENNRALFRLLFR